MNAKDLNPVLAETLGANPETGEHVTAETLYDRDNHADFLLLVIIEDWATARKSLKYWADKLAKQAAHVAETGDSRGVSVAQSFADYQGAVSAVDALSTPLRVAIDIYKKAHGWTS